MWSIRILSYLILNVIGLIAVICVNILSVLGVIGGIRPDYVSNKYFTILTPSSFAFSIWGVIYILLIFFVGYQIYSFAKREVHIVQKTDLWFFLSCIFNVVWIFAWHYQFIELSFVFILLLLFSLVMVYRGIGIGRFEGTLAERIFMYIPFSVYLGWVTVATLLNLLVLLTKLNFSFYLLYQDLWGLGSVVLLIFISLSVLFFRNDVFFALSVLWASVGGLLSRLHDNNIQDNFTTSSLIACITILSIYILVKLIRGKIYTF